MKRAVILLLQNFFDRHLNSTDVKIQLVPKADLDVDSPKFTADRSKLLKCDRVV